VNYALTPLGCCVAEALAPLCPWGSKNMADVSRIFERDTCRDGKGS
jgi:DNA-binding HxlR family transcriptional regulator